MAVDALEVSQPAVATPEAAESTTTEHEKTLSEVEKLESLLLHDERSCIFETRVERAALCRDHGSAQFKLKNVPSAIKWYERALFHVEFDDGTWHFEFLDKHRDAVNQVRLPVYLNLAMCYLAEPTQDLAKVIENADEALKIDAKNAKALYRCGKAHLLHNNLDAARTKLKLAVQLQPNDKNIREALQSLAEKTVDARAKEKETWGGRLLDTKTEQDGHHSDESGDTRQQDANKSPAAEGGHALSKTRSSSWFMPLLVLLIAIVTALVLVLPRS